MSAPFSRPRTRPIPVGNLRAFAAVARLRGFGAAAEELSLTQSAVSRQIQALEDDVGVPLFLRHTRAVEPTEAGVHLLRAVVESLDAIDAAVRTLRRQAGRRSVAVTTWVSFASMWLIPRLEAFQAEHPDIDLRIDATDAVIELDHSDDDIAIRYSRPEAAPAGAERLFGEQLTAVASPWLLQSRGAVREPRDLAGFTWIESGESERNPKLRALSWRYWLAHHGLAPLEPRRWLHLNYASQLVQAAVAGQGVALARTPLVADHLARGDLVELLPGLRMTTPMVAWLLVSPGGGARPEVGAFRDWVLTQARLTRQALGEAS
jgi:DNA-binding transcriptional LysR family regulator